MFRSICQAFLYLIYFAEGIDLGEIYNEVASVNTTWSPMLSIWAETNALRSSNLSSLDRTTTHWSDMIGFL